MNIRKPLAASALIIGLSSVGLAVSRGRAVGERAGSVGGRRLWQPRPRIGLSADATGVHHHDHRSRWRSARRRAGAYLRRRRAIPDLLGLGPGQLGNDGDDHVRQPRRFELRRQRSPAFGEDPVAWRCCQCRRRAGRLAGLDATGKRDVGSRRRVELGSSAHHRPHRGEPVGHARRLVPGGHTRLRRRPTVPRRPANTSSDR